MAEPTEKSSEIEELLNEALGFEGTNTRADSIRADRCVPPPIGCGGSATEFRDPLSAKEYTISGLCQKCQDGIFGTGEEDPMDTMAAEDPPLPPMSSEDKIHALVDGMGYTEDEAVAFLVDMGEIDVRERE